MKKKDNVIHVNFKKPKRRKSESLEEDFSFFNKFPTRADLEPNLIDYMFPFLLRVSVILLILSLALLIF